MTDAEKLVNLQEELDEAHALLVEVHDKCNVRSVFFGPVREYLVSRCLVEG